MKFEIAKEEFIQILSDFSVILRDNSVKPVLAGIYIETNDSGLTFYGTNLEVDLIKTTQCKIERTGKTVIKPGLILEYIKLVESETLSVELVNDTLFVHCAEFLVMDVENYPTIKKLSGTEITELLPLQIKETLEKVKFCASQSPDNLAVNVVRINFFQDYAEFVSTDSFRLAYLKENISSKTECKFSMPVDSVNSLIKLMKISSENSVKIGFQDNYMIFNWENTYFATKVIELPFPEYKAIFANSSFSKEMEFSNSDIKSSLRKVISISKGSTELKFGGSFDFKGKKLEIKASSGSAKISEKVPMIKNGEDFKASLNAKYLLDFINMVDKNIVIKGNDQHSMFQVQEFNKDNYLYILMPLAVR